MKYLVAFLLWSCLRLSAFEALVVSIVSGDSLIVQTAEMERLRLHLAGMDAPEMPKGTLSGQPFAREAKQELNKITLGSTVTVLIEKPHEYEGYYAILISRPGICINTYMVESGLAIVTEIHDPYYRARLEASCSLAKQNNWGIWSLATLETPFEYRQRTKKRHLD